MVFISYITGGDPISVLFSVSEFLTGEGLTLAMFLKDIRKLKAQEAALEEQKKRADQLLLNILPKAVMDQLEHDPNQLIAQKYTRVTIAFVDIVEYCNFVLSK